MESDILNKLEAMGCDMKGAMGRFVDDEELYLSFLGPVMDDPAFALLGEGIAQQDASKAFESAHSLKGTIGNMGLTPLYSRIVDIVEPLRAGSLEGIPEKYSELIIERDDLKKKLGY